MRVLELSWKLDHIITLVYDTPWCLFLFTSKYYTESPHAHPFDYHIFSHISLNAVSDRERHVVILFRHAWIFFLSVKNVSANPISA